MNCRCTRESRELYQHHPDVMGHGPEMLPPGMSPHAGAMEHAARFQRSPHYQRYMQSGRALPRMYAGPTGPSPLPGFSSPPEYPGFSNRGPIQPLQGNSPFAGPIGPMRAPGALMYTSLRPSQRPPWMMQRSQYLPQYARAPLGAPGGYERVGYAPQPGPFMPPQYGAQFVPGMGLAYGVPPGLEAFPSLQQRFPVRVDYPLPGVPRPVIPSVTEYSFTRSPDGGYHNRIRRHPAVYAFSGRNWPAGPAAEPYLPPYTGGAAEVSPQIAQALQLQRYQFQTAASMLASETQRFLVESASNPAYRIHAEAVAHMQATLVAMLRMPPIMPVPEGQIQQLQAIADGWTQLNVSVGRAAPPIPPIYPVPPFSLASAPAPRLPVAPRTYVRASAEFLVTPVQAQSRITFTQQAENIVVFVGQQRVDIRADQFPTGPQAFVDPRGVRIERTTAANTFVIVCAGTGPFRVAHAATVQMTTAG